jgi:hypothetical protein
LRALYEIAATDSTLLTASLVEIVDYQLSKLFVFQLSNPVFLEVDESRLNGYLCACGGILSRKMPDNFGKPLTLYQRVLASVQNNFQVQFYVLLCQLD